MIKTVCLHGNNVPTVKDCVIEKAKSSTTEYYHKMIASSKELEKKTKEEIFTANLSRRHDFPTPESPISRSLKR